MDHVPTCMYLMSESNKQIKINKERSKRAGPASHREIPGRPWAIKNISDENDLC